MSAVSKGLKRRGRLLVQALRPPTSNAGSGTAAARRTRETGETDRYVAPHTPRLVESPVFILSPVRSGSTLLRVLLNSHSKIRAPHEMHLRTLHVHMDRDFTPDAMKELELDKSELEHLLWDRVLDLELKRSGKEIVVDKTPPNALIWPRLRRCWPQARYLFLLRHPEGVVTSLVNRRRKPDLAQIHAEVLRYAEKLEEARQTLPGHTVTYEQLTGEPEKATREICRFLGVEWEAGMLDYGRHDHGTFRPHMGDWSTTITSGKIQPARRVDHRPDLPPRLAEIAEAWGYQATTTV
ncbi:sulfotransferase [Streptomyces luomodiensis]|uniref:Sulfotransferase n=1 Tax=Streptomyces luomodiensis TaxID=3026192 RepID=A0ABY9URI5_9ACTN|nr:sulfotransferase [Streptomyces sp. SCA4-21]WNE95158.1 sulfotransferase [Streptomyces sp. SCA4-21]